MTSATFTKYNESILDVPPDLNTDDIRIKCVGSTAGKVITGATNATPIVITCNSHGYANGDRVLIKAVGGNANANGHFVIQNILTNSFELTNPSTGANIAGSGAYTSGGLVLNLSSNDFLDDINAAVIAGTTIILSPTIANGVYDHADITFTAVPTANSIEWFVWYKHTGVNSTSRLIYVTDSWSTAPNPIPTNGGDVVLQLNASGLFKIVA